MAGEQACNVQVKPSVLEWGGLAKWDAQAVSPTQEHTLRPRRHAHSGRPLSDRGSKQQPVYSIDFIYASKNLFVPTIGETFMTFKSDTCLVFSIHKGWANF